MRELTGAEIEVLAARPKVRAHRTMEADVCPHADKRWSTMQVTCPRREVKTLSLTVEPKTQG